MAVVNLQDVIAAGDMNLLTETELEEVGYEEPVLPDYDDHSANLAEKLSENQRRTLAYSVKQVYEEDESSRKEWFDRERDGIRLLGVSENTIPGAEFDGSSEVTFPALIEAIIQFQARAMAELWPADGIAKAIVLGTPDEEAYDQADRVKDYLNYLYDEEMPDAFEETDRMLFQLPLAGSAFVKIYHDDLTEKITKRLVNSEDFVAPYEATDFGTIPRYTHVIRMNRRDLLMLQRDGYYLDTPIRPPIDETGQTDQTLRDERDDVNSVQKVNYFSKGHRHVLFEHFCYLGDEPGFEEFAVEGIPAPYFVTVESEAQELLSIRRAWAPGDDAYKAHHPWIHYKFLPGFGFYGLGYYHILGDLARALTGSLRALMDSAQFANLQSGIRSRDARMPDDAKPAAPGRFVETEATSEELKNAFILFPFKEPSPTLFNLLQWLDDVIRRLSGSTEVAVGDAPNNAPVGTTLALIEQTEKVQTGIHIRLHRAQRKELKLVASLARLYMEEEYPYRIEGKEGSIKQEDFDGRVDVVPLSDPNVVSATQRIARAQAEKELAAEAPDLFDRRQVYKRMLAAFGTANPDELLPDEEEVPHQGPVEEAMALHVGEPVKAYPDQDHAAHIQVHQAWFMNLDPETAKMVEGAYFAHIGEHMALQYQAQMLQLMGLDPLYQPQTPEEENLLATMAAQAAQVMMQARGADPELDEAARKAEVDAMKANAEVQRKDMVALAQVERDDAMMRARMQREVVEAEEKLLREQMSDEAKLYADSLNPQQDKGNQKLGGGKPSNAKRLER